MKLTKKQFGYGIIFLNLAAQVTFILLHKAGFKFMSFYNPTYAIVTTLALILLGLWYIKPPYLDDEPAENIKIEENQNA